MPVEKVQEDFFNNLLETRRAMVWQGEALSESAFGRIYLAAIAAVLLMVFLYGQIDYQARPFADWDLASYRKMAQAAPGLSPEVVRPFAYRLLGPFLAGLLPLPDPAAFYGLAVALSFCLVLLFWRLLRAAGFSVPVSLATAWLLVCNKYFFGFTVWDYFQLNDLLALNLLAVMFPAMWKKQWALFAAAMALCAAARETAMLMIPVLLLYLWEEKSPPGQWLKALAAILPGVLVFGLIRALAPSAGGSGLLESLASHWHKLFSIRELAALLLNAFAPFCLAPLFFPRTCLEFFKARKHALLFAGLVFLSTLFGSNNERLMSPAGLVFYPLVAAIFTGLSLSRRDWALLLAMGFAASLHHVYGRWPLPSAAWTLAFTGFSTLAVTLSLYMASRRKACDTS